MGSTEQTRWFKWRPAPAWRRADSPSGFGGQISVERDANEIREASARNAIPRQRRGLGDRRRGRQEDVTVHDSDQIRVVESTLTRRYGRYTSIWHHSGPVRGEKKKGEHT